MCFNSEKGQSMVEFALVLPILILLLCGIINFGWIFGNQLLANNACREAARYSSIHYNDSNIDDDQAIAAEIVAERASTLVSPIVTLTKSDSSDIITVNVSSKVIVLTPILSMLCKDGEYTVTAQCVMRLE